MHSLKPYLTKSTNNLLQNSAEIFRLQPRFKAHSRLKCSWVCNTITTSLPNYSPKSLRIPLLTWSIPWHHSRWLLLPSSQPHSVRSRAPPHHTRRAMERARIGRSLIIHFRSYRVGNQTTIYLTEYDVRSLYIFLPRLALYTSSLYITIHTMYDPDDGRECYRIRQSTVTTDPVSLCQSVRDG